MAMSSSRDGDAFMIMEWMSSSPVGTLIVSGGEEEEEVVFQGRLPVQAKKGAEDFRRWLA